MSKYSLEIISKDRKNDGEVFQSYRLDGKETIGVSKREPFAIRFKNHTWSRVQLRLSVDGTDILTGDPASTSPRGKMWVVESRGEVELNAWPENNRGGARFVFGDSEKGVAANTHGDTSGVGLIAAAVFSEGYKEIFSPEIFSPMWSTRDVRLGGKSDRRFRSRNVDFSADTKCAAMPESINLIGECREYGLDADALEEGPAVGAGEYVNQAISKTAGLRSPELDQVLEVKYEWWDKLRRKLGRYRGRDAFPGDNDQNINLRGVPRQRSHGRKPVYKYL
jgi:hypothetical protein